MDRYTAVRQAYARQVTVAAPDPRLRAAFAAVPRERFLSAPDLPPTQVYADTTLALGPCGINTGQPSLHAECLAALGLHPDETVIHVGAGMGYYTAILAHLVAAVEAFELEPELARRAQANLAEYPGVRLHARSGAEPPLPPGDVVYVNCGATAPLPLWLDALRPGGRLLLPLTAGDGSGRMLLLHRPQQPGSWPARFLSPVLFIACHGTRDPVESSRLESAFARGGSHTVRSFRRNSAPDATAWCATPAWWLSTAPAAAPAG